MSTELVESPQKDNTPPSNHSSQDTNNSADKVSASPLGEQAKRWRKAMGSRWELLQTNQIIYLIALVLFIVVEHDLDFSSISLWLVGSLAFFGMARELWAIFHKVWESTLGRLVLIVVYAAIANFTLALAAQKVNQVIGVDPTYLYHTQGLTTLLILPIWIMLASVVAMILTFGVMQILKLITGLFIVLRIIGKKSKNKEAFPKTFVLIRLVLLIPVTAMISNSMGWYLQQLNLPNSKGFQFNLELTEDQRKLANDTAIGIIDADLQNPDLSPEERQELLEARTKITTAFANRQNLADGNQPLLEDLPLVEQEPLADREPLAGIEPSANTEVLTDKQTSTNLDANSTERKGVVLDKIIATFVFSYEAFQYSHCAKLPYERVVYISEQQILVAIEDESSYTGYTFTARDCIENK